MNTRDPHAVLGVPRGADRAAIRRAFKERLLATHPDRGGDPAEFRAVVEAMRSLEPHARARGSQVVQGWLLTTLEALLAALRQGDAKAVRAALTTLEAGMTRWWSTAEDVERGLRRGDLAGSLEAGVALFEAVEPELSALGRALRLRRRRRL